jgi:CRISPR/Cas system-associated protein Csm6
MGSRVPVRAAWLRVMGARKMSDDLGFLGQRGTFFVGFSQDLEKVDCDVICEIRESRLFSDKYCDDLSKFKPFINQ